MEQLYHRHKIGAIIINTDMSTRSKPNGSERITYSRNRPYVWIKIDDKWIQKHRYVMECHLGRKLGIDEHVHHGPGGTLDNSIGNLTLMTAEEHRRHHRSEPHLSRPKTECAYCGKLIPHSQYKEYCDVRCRFYATHVTRRCKTCGDRFIAYRKSKTANCEKCRGRRSPRANGS